MRTHFFNTKNRTSQVVMQGDNLMCAAKAEQELRQKKRYLTRVRTRNQRIGR